METLGQWYKRELARAKTWQRREYLCMLRDDDIDRLDEPARQHISELTDKSANAILASTLWADGYHNAIMVAAGELVAAGMGDYAYVTQYASGTTVWAIDCPTWGYSPVLVDRYGAIVR